MQVHKENLAAALRVAINAREEAEKRAGYTGDSGFVAGLRDVLKHIEAGGQIQIIDSDYRPPQTRRLG